MYLYILTERDSERVIGVFDTISAAHAIAASMLTERYGERFTGFDFDVYRQSPGVPPGDGRALHWTDTSEFLSGIPVKRDWTFYIDRVPYMRGDEVVGDPENHLALEDE